MSISITTVSALGIVLPVAEVETRWGLRSGSASGLHWLCLRFVFRHSAAGENKPGQRNTGLLCQVTSLTHTHTHYTESVEFSVCACMHQCWSCLLCVSRRSSPDSSSSISSLLHQSNQLKKTTGEVREQNINTTHTTCPLSVFAVKQPDRETSDLGLFIILLELVQSKPEQRRWNVLIWKCVSSIFKIKR